MQPDDLVIYSRSHYEVLVGYDLIRESAARRTDVLGRVTYDKVDRRNDISGRVTAVGDGWVQVLWTATGKKTCHFPENLELARGTAGWI